MSLLALLILVPGIIFGLLFLLTGKLPGRKTLFIFTMVIAGLCVLSLVVSLVSNFGRKEYRADSRLMATIHYIESHLDENARLPNEAELKGWEKQQVGIYFELDSYPANDSLNYVLTSWDGDQFQSYDSKTATFRSGF